MDNLLADTIVTNFNLLLPIIPVVLFVVVMIMNNRKKMSAGVICRKEQL